MERDEIRGLLKISSADETWLKDRAKELSRLLVPLQQAYGAEIAKWEGEFGEPFPKTLEDWQRWLARIDAPGRFLPADKAASGKWTGADILPSFGGSKRRPWPAAGGKAGADAGAERQKSRRPLTSVQTEAIQIVGECRGNVARAAAAAWKGPKDSLSGIPGGPEKTRQAGGQVRHADICTRPARPRRSGGRRRPAGLG